MAAGTGDGVELELRYYARIGERVKLELEVGYLLIRRGSLAELSALQCLL